MDKSCTFRNRFSQVFAALAVIVSVAGCAHMHDRLIVSGVPAQVDNKYTSSSYDPSNPPLRQNDYYLVFEQCDGDIQESKLIGQPSDPHYDPATNAIAAGCFSVTYSVSKSTYDKYTVGSEVVFTGKTGDTVERVA